MPGEQDPSKFEAFKSTVGSTLESIKGKTAIALIGAVGLTGGAIAEQASTEPARAADVPEATASDQLQDCVDDALDDPLVMRSNMYFTGAKHNQTIDGMMRFKPTSAACAPLVSRETPVVQVKMQNPNNHKKLIKSKKKELEGSTKEGVTIPMDANGSRYGGINFSKYSGDGNKLRYRCTPGKDITKAWMTYTVRAASPVDGETLGKISFTQRVKIPHKPRHLLRDHELPGPC